MSKTNQNPDVIEIGEAKPDCAPLGLLERMADAGLELAQYASYAEIVGGISHNRTQIREWCDKIYEFHRERERLRSNTGVPITPDSTEKYENTNWSDTGSRPEMARG